MGTVMTILLSRSNGALNVQDGLKWQTHCITVLHHQTHSACAEFPCAHTEAARWKLGIHKYVYINQVLRLQWPKVG